jgi:hypothetical protein
MIDVGGIRFSIPLYARVKVPNDEWSSKGADALAKDTAAFERARTYAKRVREGELNFNSEHLEAAPNAYVGWLDLMGAGHVMGTSVQKTANFLARLHIAVERARRATNFAGRLLPINDGIFIVSTKKREFISLLGHAMIMLSANFIAVPRPHDRFLLRGGIAYGPVYFGEMLNGGLRPKKFRDGASFMNSLMFGPALIQAYRSENSAPPYGIAVHESARAFHPPDEQPFRMTHWMWWAPNEEVDYPQRIPPLTELKDCLSEDLVKHFQWLADSRIYHGLDAAKINHWRDQCQEYFRLG